MYCLSQFITGLFCHQGFVYANALLIAHTQESKKLFIPILQESFQAKTSRICSGILILAKILLHTNSAKIKYLLVCWLCQSSRGLLNTMFHFPVNKKFSSNVNSLSYYQTMLLLSRVLLLMQHHQRCHQSSVQALLLLISNCIQFNLTQLPLFPQKQLFTKRYAHIFQDIKDLLKVQCMPTSQASTQ